MARARFDSGRPVVWLAVLAVGLGARAALALAGGSIGVAGPLDKVRPSDPVPAATAAAIDAAANEFEPFQIVVNGGATGVTGVTAGAAVDMAEVTLYRVALYDVVVPSNSEGAAGPWPDALVPDVDTYYGETRNAFPFDVPAGESRSIWVDVFVPAGTPPGTYTGMVSVSAASGLPATVVPVTLRVRAFGLPSTATLKSAFGVRWDTCAAHLGSYAACGDPGIEEYSTLYARAALDHRLSLESVIYYGPDGTDWTRLDGWYAPLLDGTAPTRLEGARLTTVRLMTSDPAEMILWESHFASRGWLDRLFDYTCDEPPAGCAYSEIPGLAAPVHAAGLRTLVTADIDEVVTYDFWDDIDLLVPVVNAMHDRGSSSRRAEYDAFLTGGAEKELWWYQSCMSHGCGGGCVGTSDPYFTGWPSYVIDASGIQNRAMEWLSWSYDIGGELYFETTYLLASAWTDQCDFSGNGDGTLFYPGTPAVIGGSSHIPVESLRLKLIREGMEDYEYLALVASLGDAALADAEAAGLFSAPYEVTSTSPGDLFAARGRIADRIEELSGVKPPPPPRLALDVFGAAEPPAIDGVLDEYAVAAPLTVSVPGGASATFYLLWDATALYVGANVNDVDLEARGTGPDGELWDADGIELLFDPLSTHSALPDADDRHVIVTAALDLLDAAGAGAGEDRSVTLGIVHAVVSSGTLSDGPGDGGYVVELSIPWSGLGRAPIEGDLVGADLALNDASTGGGRAYADWAELTDFAQPDRWNDLVLGPVLPVDPVEPPPPGPPDGCHCRVGRAGAPPAPLGLVVLAALVLALRSRPGGRLGKD